MHITDRSETIDAVLDRSEVFEHAILNCFPDSGVVLALTRPQHELTAAACSISIEHAHVLRAAFLVDAPNSASAVLRLQYEALLRGVWLMFAATTAQVEKLAATLDLESEQAAKNLPGYMEMLNAVKKVAPAGLAEPLAEFNQYSRHSLNSFVHGGIHPLHRTRHGYPAEMATTVVHFSNGLMHMAYRLLATLSGSQRRMDRVTRLYIDFCDCLPMAKP
jgi:hypothetical protein